MLPRAQINVTPMIDVMLVLLIIFMIVTPIIESRVALPRSDHADARPEEPDEVVLGIDRNGTYFLSITGALAPRESALHVIGADALRDRLGALYAHRTKDRLLYLKADSELPFRVLQEAIEIARTSGVRVVAAVTERATVRAVSPSYPRVVPAQ